MTAILERSICKLLTQLRRLFLLPESEWLAFAPTIPPTTRGEAASLIVDGAVASLLAAEGPSVASGALASQLTLRRILSASLTLDDVATPGIDDLAIRMALARSTQLGGQLARCFALDSSLPFTREVERRSSAALPRRPVVLIALQHLLGSAMSVFEGLNRLGVAFADMFVGGKVYSAHRAVTLRLESLGAYVHRDCLVLPDWEWLSRRGYSDKLADIARELLQRAAERIDAMRSAGIDARVLVLDDGGVAIDILQHEFPRLVPLSAGVEQTRRGAHRLRASRGPLIPVVNVAESRAKLDRESPMIGRSVVHELLRRPVVRDRASGLRKRQAAVIGYGSVGRSVATELRAQGIRVVAADTNADRLALAHKDGCRAVTLDAALRSASVIVGCVGHSWLTPELASCIQEGTVLASASTSDDEFRGIDAQDRDAMLMHPGLAHDVASDFQRTHSDYAIRVPDRSVILVNGGFPVNFDGSLDPIAVDQIQLTRALMLAGAVQALSLDVAEGLVPLARDWDDLMIELSAGVSQC